MYEAFPKAHRVGVTATPIRLDGSGLSDVNDELVIGVSEKWLIENNCLSPYDYYAPSLVDLTGIKIKKGDYDISSVENLMLRKAVFGDVIKYYKELADGKQAICYCTSVRHSMETAMQFNIAGIEAVHVDGSTPKAERERIMNDFRRGATGINLSLVIRNDVEQKYKDRYLFHTLWKRKEPTEADMQVQGYSFKQIMILAKAAKLPSGKSYENVQQLCEDLLKRPLRVTVEHETNDYNGKTRENIRYINESKFPECRHVFKEKKSAASSETVAQKPQEQFAADNASFGSLDDFEEILSDGDVPF